MIPALVEKIHDRHIANHQQGHDDELLAGLGDQIFQIRVDNTHIAELGHNRGQGGLEAAVILAGTDGIGPLLEHLVLDFRLQGLEGCLHIRINQFDLSQKTGKHIADGRVEILDAFLYCRKDILIAQIRGGDDGERRFQLGGHALLVVDRREPDRPEGQEHQAGRQHRDEKQIAQQDSQASSHGKEQQ
ncbi:hypothetical protein DSY4562 [Desulfitobacterium hafniense Y51]|uniref:Uncharacterized protein n=1 Tax=Desulfitobacterium hafniense (strain Y51) TaxID=138119 RepID=Q24NP1_DESHY|nr:hypothetical protein DSY4562 [Desulfitobacterium hafniense Y51]